MLLAYGGGGNGDEVENDLAEEEKCQLEEVKEANKEERKEVLEMEAEVRSKEFFSVTSYNHKVSV